MERSDFAMTPLAKEQRDGISVERVAELFRAVMHAGDV